ncbi:MAG: universal stress protein [Paraburkholderia sp.]|uniref:universal stress protein n=1 Tax=Paraburkholderia sp. TaxID=1926495 RepID=UPI0011F7E02A|nr:universal stress protein [Paraburkholderia sp.]TAM08050.1 MAG: universal stress protein [Paraburkholderia sp.]TAM30044.1 MAG: universal stress protein [Paraburkholderia sp.]
MYQKILVAVDGSDTSKHALAEALRVARLTGGSIRVSIVIDVVAPFGFGMTYVPAELISGFREDALKRLEAARSQVEAAGVPCDTELLELHELADDIAGCLVRDAERYGADLAVLGTHGRRGVRRAVVGSVAESFVRQASCPVLLVRGAEPEAEPD